MRIHFWVLSALLFCSVVHGGAHSGGGSAEVKATAGAHQHDNAEPTPVASTAPRMAVTGKEVTYGQIDGTELKGYLVKPVGAADDLPALIVIHEWWGLNDNLRGAADRLAGEGYTALAVDLYDGQTADIPKNAIKLMTALMDDTERGDENLRQAYSYLKSTLGAPRVGSIGWCLGGRWSLRSAVLMPDQLDATVMYYGNVTLEDAELEPLQMPVLGNFASDDPVVPLDSVMAFDAKMQSLGKDADIKIYEGAKHGFSNPSGMSYDATAATDAWQRTIGFLRANLVD